MLERQDAMNTQVNPTWLTASNNWMLAAMQEGAEAIDHHGWKWWKNQEPDLPQLQMELVDIWHFGLSKMLVIEKGNVDSVINKLISDSESESIMFDNYQYFYKAQDLLNNLQLLTALAGADRFSIQLFLKIIEQSGMTTDDLYKLYIGKNVLNFFRQDNGYKEGTYMKIWLGLEDNVRLNRLLEETDPTSETFADDLYDALERTYESIKTVAH
jgi:dimeric dUTPase (all-alpha-NTP-PPase superfamily)